MPSAIPNFKDIENEVWLLPDFICKCVLLAQHNQLTQEKAEKLFWYLKPAWADKEGEKTYLYNSIEISPLWLQDFITNIIDKI